MMPSPAKQRFGERHFGVGKGLDFFRYHQARFHFGLRPALREAHETHRDDALHLARKPHGFEPGIH